MFAYSKSVLNEVLEKIQVVQVEQGKFMYQGRAAEQLVLL